VQFLRLSLTHRTLLSFTPATEQLQRAVLLLCGYLIPREDGRHIP